jgi:hypothetical protein
MKAFQCDVNISIIRNKTEEKFLSFRLHISSLPNSERSLKHIFTSRTSGHCLGTSKTGDVQNIFLAPLITESHYHHFFLPSPSLNLVAAMMNYILPLYEWTHDLECH